MKTIMVLLLLLLGIMPAHGATGGEPPDCPDVVDAIDGPVHEVADEYTAWLKLCGGVAKQNIEVSYKFVDGTAKQGEDYQARQSGTVTIKEGQSQAGVPYTVLRVTAQQKKFTLQITSVKPGKIGKAVAVFTIGGGK